MTMTQHSYLGLGPTGLHRIAHQRGDPAARHVGICVHRLSRSDRD
jgi:hypothetical protein